MWRSIKLIVKFCSLKWLSTSEQTKRWLRSRPPPHRHWLINKHAYDKRVHAFSKRTTVSGPNKLNFISLWTCCRRRHTRFVSRCTITIISRSTFLSVECWKPTNNEQKKNSIYRDNSSNATSMHCTAPCKIHRWWIRKKSILAFSWKFLWICLFTEPDRLLFSLSLNTFLIN